MSRSQGPKPASLSGISLHSGKQSTITFIPGKEPGIFFVLQGKKIEAVAENVTDTKRGTSLQAVHVVEHVLSAVSGLGINSIVIELSENEPPAMDGSAHPFARALIKAGFSSQGVKPFKLSEKISLSENGAKIEAVPYDGFAIDFIIDFPGIGRQKYIFEKDYLKEIAPARTFGYQEELEALKKAGLAKGASLDTALALNKDGYINTPRFKDEPVRHKILDLIGDLALVGAPIHAKITANRSGHSLNVALAKAIRGQIKKQGGF